MEREQGAILALAAVYTRHHGPQLSPVLKQKNWFYKVYYTSEDIIRIFSHYILKTLKRISVKSSLLPKISLPL